MPAEIQREQITIRFLRMTLFPGTIGAVFCNSDFVFTITLRAGGRSEEESEEEVPESPSAPDSEEDEEEEDEEEDEEDEEDVRTSRRRMGRLR